jgi:hypothetical protein
MPRPGWPNSTELAFLQRHLPQYEVCKANWSYSGFWTTTLRAFVEETKAFKRWFPGKKDKSELNEDEVKEYNAHYEKLNKVSAHI